MPGFVVMFDPLSMLYTHDFDLTEALLDEPAVAPNVYSSLISGSSD